MVKICTICKIEKPLELFHKSGKGENKRRSDCAECTKLKITSHNTKLRLNALKHYGGKCMCCGFNDLTKRVNGHSFLHFDHINGGGRAHVRKNPHLAHWLTKNNYPIGFRVLCAACNISMQPGESTCELHKWQLVKT